jgi:hypothetical protein
MATSKSEPVNITFQLKEDDADTFRQYMEHEFIQINSVAAKKLLLERLKQWKTEAEPALT